MRKSFIAGVMGLALAGCAHSRSELARTPDGKKPDGPVGLTPIPSIHDSINRGTGGAALAQAALGDPNDPRWAGIAPNPGANPPGPPGANPSGPPGTSTPSQATQMAATGASPAQPGPPSGVPPQPAATFARPTAQPDPSGLAGNPGGAVPDRLAAQRGPSIPPGDAGGDLPDRLNPTPDLTAAAAAAAATMPPLTSAAAARGGAPVATGALPPSVAPAAGMASASPANNPQVPGGRSPIASVPYTLQRPGGPMPDTLSRPDGRPASPAGPTPDALGGAPDGPPGVDPAGPKMAGPTANGLEPVGAPPAAPSLDAPSIQPAPGRTDAAVSPSAGTAAPTPAAATRKPRPAGDPLLGPNPDLMPELPPLPATAPSAKSAASGPAGKPSATAPAPVPAAAAGDLPPLGAPSSPPGPSAGNAPAAGADAPAPTPGPEPAGGPSAPPELGSPSVDNGPAPAGPTVAQAQLADLPPLEPVRPASRASGGRVQQAVASVDTTDSSRRAPARRDGQIVRTSFQQPPGPTDLQIPTSWRQATMMAAKVGDEIITVRDLRAAVNEYCHRKNIPFNGLPPEQKGACAAMIMRELIDQSLLIQEAKRTIKSPKMYDQFTSEAERYWREDQLPLLETEFAADSEQQLREKLKERGRSIETMSLMAKRGWMAENFLHAKIKDRMKVELPDLRKYYHEHLHDPEYDRPARITWREIVVETSPQTSKEQARRKIEAIYQSLRRGADFAAVARAQSEGPSRSREQGGLMQTSPGSYSVASVNQALGSLPLGQVSPILEGPSSFHIVRVEERRAAGPAPFEELYDEIRSALLEKKVQAERAAYLKKLRQETLVTNFIDDQARDTRRASR